MEESGILGPIGLGVEIFGLLLVIPGAVMMYRNSIRDAERRRATGMTDYTPADGQRALRMLREGTIEDAGGREVLGLQLAAQTLRSRRALIFPFAGFTCVMLGLLLLSPSLLHLLVAVFGLGYAAGAVRIERNARIGDAFLRRYPLDLPEQTRP